MYIRTLREIPILYIGTLWEIPALYIGALWEIPTLCAGTLWDISRENCRRTLRTVGSKVRGRRSGIAMVGV